MSTMYVRKIKTSHCAYTGRSLSVSFRVDPPLSPQGLLRRYKLEKYSFRSVLGTSAFGYSGMAHLYDYRGPVPENLDLVDIYVRAFNKATGKFRKLPKRLPYCWDAPLCTVQKAAKRFYIKFDPYQLILMGFSIDTEIEIVQVNSTK